MRRMLSITILLALSACQSMPAAPKGNTCIVDVAANGSDCVPISTAVKMNRVNAKDANSFVPFKQMDNYICFSPSTWANIQTYIGDLKLLAQKQCTF